MTFFNTKLPLVIFFIIIIEVAILFTQYIEFLSRSNEKKRLYHILLILILILYNIAEGFFPDENIKWVSTDFQYFLGYGFGYLFAAYCPLYFYRSMEIGALKFHGRFGYLFVVIPTVVFYGIVFPITHDLTLTRKYIYIVPALYALTLFYSAIFEIRKAYLKDKNRQLRTERLCYFFAVFPVSVTPIFGAFLGFPKWAITTFFNVGFLVVNWILMQQLITKAKNEQLQLQVMIDNIQNSKLNASEIFIQNCKQYNLTNREIEIVNYISQGIKYKDVANRLFISEPTVKKHIQNIFFKTGASNKIELIKILSTV